MILQWESSLVSPLLRRAAPTPMPHGQPGRDSWRLGVIAVLNKTHSLTHPGLADGSQRGPGIEGCALQASAIHSSRKLSPKRASYQTPAQTSLTPYYAPGDTPACHADRHPEGEKNVTAHISYSEVKHLMAKGLHRILPKQVWHHPQSSPFGSEGTCIAYRPAASLEGLQRAPGTDQGITRKRHHLGCASGWEQQGTALGTEAAEQLGELRKQSCWRKPQPELRTSKATCSFLSERNYCERVVPQPGAQSPLDQPGPAVGELFLHLWVR